MRDRRACIQLPDVISLAGEAAGIDTQKHVVQQTIVSAAIPRHQSRPDLVLQFQKEGQIIGRSARLTHGFAALAAFNIASLTTLTGALP